MPTPRPDRSVTASAVEKPGWKIRSQTCASVGFSGTARPRSAALARMRSRFRPRPSSLTSMTMWPPWCEAARVMVPVSSLPACARTSGISRPWSIELRTRCTSGSAMRSIRPLSSSVPSPMVRRRTCLPRRADRSRTRRGKRRNTASTGSMRTPMTASCRSRVLRSSRSRPANRRSHWAWSSMPETCFSMAWVMTSSPTRLIRPSILSTLTRMEVSAASLAAGAAAVAGACVPLATTAVAGCAATATASTGTALRCMGWMSSSQSSTTQANTSSTALRGTLPIRPRSQAR